MANVRLYSIAVAAVASSVLVLACNKGGSDDKPEKTGEAPIIGDSCKGMSAMDGELSCDDDKVIFCSSFSDYKWKMTQECKGGTKCTAEPDGKTASCK